MDKGDTLIGLNFSPTEHKRDNINGISIKGIQKLSRKEKERLRKSLYRRRKKNRKK